MITAGVKTYNWPSHLQATEPLVLDDMALAAMEFRQRVHDAHLAGFDGPFTLYDYMTGGSLGYDCAARTGRDCLSAWVRWEERDEH